MYTIIVKDDDKKVYAAHGTRLNVVMSEIIVFLTDKYGFNRRV
jgi:hypothetical protein